MAKKPITLQHVTRKILKEEISASEQRLGARITAIDGKIETTAQSLKDYTDSRFIQLDSRIKTMDSTIKTLDTKIDGMDAKMTRYFEGIGSMLEGLTGTSAATRDRLNNHEQRITVLEGRGPQATKT